MSPLAHLRALLVLGLPLVGSNLAQMALHVSDTVMLGWYGVPELAAVVLGGALFFILFILGSGFAYAVIGMVSAALGSGDETQARRDTRMALWLSILFALLTQPVFWNSDQVLIWLGQDPQLAALAKSWLEIVGPSLLPALIMAVLRSYLSAQERAHVVLWVTLIGVGLNIAMNWVLIFGHFGAPALGIQGAAIASASVNCLGALLLMIYAARAPGLRHVELFARFWRPDWPAFRGVARMGIPIGLTSVSEGGLFQASAVMMGWIGTRELAAHGIALEFASVVFMVHMGLSNAATVRAGRAMGAGDALRLRRGALVAIVLSQLVGLVTVAVFLLFPRELIGLYLKDGDPAAPEILAFGAKLLAVAGLFQLFDAAQVMALGLLRGVQDTRVPMWIAVPSYWLVGVPASYLLAFHVGLGGIGLWLGMAMGLALVSTLLMLRFWRKRWITP